ncbi:MAG: hypothetical protein ACK4LQ_11190 [Pararhodobacter sp.]
MTFLSDLLLATAAIGAAVFCLVLSRRLRALTALDGGMGSAIAVLSAQVDDLTRALKSAQEASRQASEKLESQTRRAEGACRQLELLMASMHDLPSAPAQSQQNMAQRGPGEPAEDEPAAHARPITSWSGASARRPAEVAEGGARAATSAAGATDTPLRTRVLRRRQTTGGM